MIDRMQSARRCVSTWLKPLLARAARNYIAGETAADAIRVARSLADQGLAATLGYWDADGDSPDMVLARYSEALEALADPTLDGYLSIKAPALDYCPARVGQLVDRAVRLSRRVHFDSLGIESVDRTRALIENLPEARDQLRFTLPGRWQRSLDDADWVVERGLPVRVVKGQFPDPNDPEHDRRQGFLDVIARLAGRAASVSVATHEPSLIDAALGQLLAAGTRCDVEVLYGLGWHGAWQVARRRGVPMRVYVPYGEAYLPYCLAEAWRSPRLLYRVVADTVKASLGCAC